MSDVGKRSTSNIPLIHAHSSQIHDLHFHPYKDNILATASEDHLMKVFVVPEEGPQDNTTDFATFSGHQDAVTTFRWNPAAEGVIASGGLISPTKEVLILTFVRTGSHYPSVGCRLKGSQINSGASRRDLSP